jgi:ABC-type uncharacterized transport system substrate-binding protein
MLFSRHTKRRELLTSKKAPWNRHFWQHKCQTSVQFDTWIRHSFAHHSITSLARASSIGGISRPSAFAVVKKVRAEALVTINSPHLTTHLNRIIELADQNGLPTMSSESRWTRAGGLISYGVNYAHQYRRAANYVDKILKGNKPGDLPIEQPTKFEFVINLSTAKALGLDVPPTLIARADEVIE